MNKFVIITMLLLSMTVSMAIAIPSAGDSGFDDTYVDNRGSDNAFVVCRADQESAWISADNTGTFSPITVCNDLGYESVTAVGGTCGMVCGFCGTQGEEHYNGAGGDEDLLQYTVHWKCSNYVGEIVEEEVPEFGIISLAGVLILAGTFIYLRRRN